MMSSVALLLFLPAAWLIPNHYFPWPSAWQEGFATLSLLILIFSQARDKFSPSRWTLPLLIGVVSVGTHSALGNQLFIGDAIISVYYIILFLMSITLGQAENSSAKIHPKQSVISRFAMSILCVCIVSNGIALCQWTDACGSNLWKLDVLPGGRPFGNVAQPNHLSTILYLGLCSALILLSKNLISLSSYLLCSFYLCTGIWLSGSRTGILQLTILIILFYITGKLRIDQNREFRIAIYLIPPVFLIGALAANLVDSGLQLGGSRSLEDRIQGDTRLIHYGTLLKAIAEGPIMGYGWLQVGMAQQLFAAYFPPSHEQISYAHNILLDILIWCGLPLGLCIIAASTFLLHRLYKRSTSAESFATFAAVIGIIIHGLTEYALAYTYFLIPLGILIGTLHHREDYFQKISLSFNFMKLLGIPMTALLLLMSHEYLSIEENFREIRLRAAGIQGSNAIPERTLTDTTKFHNQLRAYLDFTGVKVRREMSEYEIKEMERLYYRYSYPPVMFRYALALGLNNRPSEAQIILDRLCRTHPPRRCQEAIDLWRDLTIDYKELNRTVIKIPG